MRIEGVILLHILYIVLAAVAIELGYYGSRWLARDAAADGDETGVSTTLRFWLYAGFLSPALIVAAFGVYGKGEIRGECFATLFALNLVMVIGARLAQRRRRKTMPPSIPYHWKQKRKPATAGKGQRGKRRKRLSIASIEGWPGTRR